MLSSRTFGNSCSNNSFCDGHTANASLPGNADATSGDFNRWSVVSAKSITVDAVCVGCRGSRTTSVEGKLLRFSRMITRIWRSGISLQAFQSNGFFLTVILSQSFSGLFACSVVASTLASSCQNAAQDTQQAYDNDGKYGCNSGSYEYD